MKLEETIGADLDALPYIIHHRMRGRVRAVYMPVSTTDEPEILGERWRAGIYRKVWIALLPVPPPYGSLKLIVPPTKETEIEGLLKVGVVPEGGGALRNSLLESRPGNRHALSEEREYYGVGKVLVARLIAESYNTGGRGVVVVRPHPEAVGFYQHIGFRALGNQGQYFILLSQEAHALFDEATE